MNRLKTLALNFEKHELLVSSASFAYTTALAIAPFLIIMLSLLAFAGSDAQQSIVEQITVLLGPGAAEAVRTIAENAKKESRFSGVSGIISFIVILISASAMFSQIRRALDKVNELESGDSSLSVLSFLKERVFLVGLVLGFIFLLVISLFVTTALAMIFSNYNTLIWKTISFITNFSVFSILFASMFHFIPSKRIPWKKCILSGLCAAVFFLIGKSLIGMYLGRSAVGSAYGAAGSLIVLLVWLYYTSLTLLLSYEFTNTIFFGEKKSNP